MPSKQRLDFNGFKVQFQIGIHGINSGRRVIGPSCQGRRRLVPGENQWPEFINQSGYIRNVVPMSVAQSDIVTLFNVLPCQRAQRRLCNTRVCDNGYLSVRNFKTGAKDEVKRLEIEEEIKREMNRVDMVGAKEELRKFKCV